MKNIMRIEDSKGNIYYPQTKAKGTFTEDGKNVEEKLSEVNASLKKVKESTNPTISVTGTIGETVTCTDGITTLTHTFTVDTTYTFNLQNRGKWTVTKSEDSVEVDVQYNGDYVAEFGGGYEQLINYTMLYDNGDEHEDITGGWDISTSLTGRTKAIIKKISDKITITATGVYDGYIKTSNTVDTSGYSHIHAVGKNSPYNGNSNGFYMFSYNPLENVLQFLPDNEKTLISTSASNFNGKNVVFGNDGGARVSNLTAELYSCFLTKPDNYQTLCQKANVSAPSTLTQLIADATKLRTIFSTDDAVNFMIAQCTGDFMASVIGDKTAFGLLGNSTYIGTIMQNEHWNKFITMSPYLSDWKTQGNTVKVPTMTSNTAPSGAVSANFYNSNEPYAYQVFESDIDNPISTSRSGYVNAETTGHGVIPSNTHITYDFGYESIFYMFDFRMHTYMSDLDSNRNIRSVKLQGSIDGINFEDISNVLALNVATTSFDGGIQSIPCISNKKYRYIKIVPMSVSNNYNNLYFPATQFYGKGVE